MWLPKPQETKTEEDPGKPSRAGGFWAQTEDPSGGGAASPRCWKKKSLGQIIKDWEIAWKWKTNSGVLLKYLKVITDRLIVMYVLHHQQNNWAKEKNDSSVELQSVLVQHVLLRCELTHKLFVNRKKMTAQYGSHLDLYTFPPAC